MPSISLGKSRRSRKPLLQLRNIGLTKLARMLETISCGFLVAWTISKINQSFHNKFILMPGCRWTSDDTVFFVCLFVCMQFAGSIAIIFILEIIVGILAFALQGQVRVDGNKNAISICS